MSRTSRSSSRWPPLSPVTQDESDVRLAIAATIDFARAHAKIPGCVLAFEAGTTPVADWPTDPDRKAKAGERSYRKLPSYDFVVGVMAGAFSSTSSQRKNTFISFNYDLVVEQALANLAIPFSYGFEPKTVNYDVDSPGVHGAGSDSAMRLLKLHGSVNWAVTGGPGGKLRVFKDYGAVRAGGFIPTLVPPTWRKTFANQLDHVWGECVDALNTATRVVVVGFSMPTTDTHFKYLLGAGLQRNVSLRSLTFVAPRAAELTVRAMEVLEVDHLRGALRVEPATTATFFLSHEHRREIARSLAPAFIAADPMPEWARNGLVAAQKVSSPFGPASS